MQTGVRRVKEGGVRADGCKVHSVGWGACRRVYEVREGGLMLAGRCRVRK